MVDIIIYKKNMNKHFKENLSTIVDILTFIATLIGLFL